MIFNPHHEDPLVDTPERLRRQLTSVAMQSMLSTRKISTECHLGQISTGGIEYGVTRWAQTSALSLMTSGQRSRVTVRLTRLSVLKMLPAQNEEMVVERYLYHYAEVRMSGCRPSWRKGGVGFRAGGARAPPLPMDLKALEAPQSLGTNRGPSIAHSSESKCAHATTDRRITFALQLTMAMLSPRSPVSLGSRVCADSLWNLRYGIER